MTHRAAVTAELRAIPAHRWRYKIGKLVIAAGLVALLKYVALPEKWPVAVVLAIAVLIGYGISEDFMKAGLKFLVAVIRDVLAAIKNGKGDGAPPP